MHRYFLGGHFRYVTNGGSAMALTNAERQRRWREKRNALAWKAEGPTWKQHAVMAIGDEYAKLIRQVLNVPKGTCDADAQMALGRRITWAEIVRIVRPVLAKEIPDCGDCGGSVKI